MMVKLKEMSIMFDYCQKGEKDQNEKIKWK